MVFWLVANSFVIYHERFTMFFAHTRSFNKILYLFNGKLTENENPLQIKNCSKSDSEFKMQIRNQRQSPNENFGLWQSLAQRRSELWEKEFSIICIEALNDCCLAKSTSHSFITNLMQQCTIHTNRKRIPNVDNTMTKWKRSSNLIRFEKVNQHDFPHFPREKGSSSGAVSNTLFTLPPPPSRLFHFFTFPTLFPCVSFRFFSLIV